MTCIRVEHGFVCGPDETVNLESYGAHIWMEWHHYHGPTFYRSERCIKAISWPSKKTWNAFERWLKDHPVK